MRSAVIHAPSIRAAVGVWTSAATPQSTVTPAVARASATAALAAPPNSDSGRDSWVASVTVAEVPAADSIASS